MTQNNMKKNELIGLLFFFENSFRARITILRGDVSRTALILALQFPSIAIVVVFAKRPAPRFITGVTITLSRKTTFIFLRKLVINREKTHLCRFIIPTKNM